MRSFVAIELDREIRQELAQVRDRGWVSGRSVRWVSPDRMHLTLHFFRDLPPSAVTHVTRAMENASEKMKPFALRVRGLGFFPDARRPRVFWAGLEDLNGSLKVLYKRLELSLAEAGFEREDRPFKPHLTLARIRDRSCRLPDPGEKLEIDFGVQTVSEMVLFKSELLPQGPLYTPLSVMTLKE